VARRIRGTITSTATAFTARTATVTRRSTGSSLAMSAIEPARRNVALTVWTIP
jgi:hypothetical protein